MPMALPNTIVIRELVCWLDPSDAVDRQRNGLHSKAYGSRE